MVFLPPIKRNYKLILILLVLTPVVIKSTSPPEPPFQEFFVNGTIERSNGGSLEGFGVMLLVTRDCGWPDSLKTYEIYMPPGFELELGSRYFDFTNAIGEFSLIVRSRIYLDEISAVVMLTDQAMVTGDTLCVDELEVREDARVIQVDDGSCCGDPEIVQIPYRLHYTVPHQTITVP